MTAAALERRRDPGLVRAFFLAAAVHLVLLGIIFVGVHWQMRPAESVAVELWELPPPPAEAPPVPKVEPRPEPKPEPPKVEKPDIVEKAPPPKPKPKPEAKPRPEPKVEAKPKPRPEDLKRLQEQLALEQKAIAQRLANEKIARDQAAARANALAEYQDAIRRKVKQNWILPQDIQGNPEVVFNVVQLPTGEVMSVKLAKPSGNPAYDAAVERAILRSSPLPLPRQRELFERELKLTFRPRD